MGVTVIDLFEFMIWVVVVFARTGKLQTCFRNQRFARTTIVTAWCWGSAISKLSQTLRVHTCSREFSWSQSLHVGPRFLVCFFCLLHISKTKCSKEAICEVLRHDRCHPPTLRNISWLFSEGRTAPLALHTAPFWQRHLSYTIQRLLMKFACWMSTILQQALKACVILMSMVDCVWTWLITSCCLRPQCWILPAKHMFVGWRCRGLRSDCQR